MRIKDNTIRVSFSPQIWAALHQLDMISMIVANKQIVITSGSEDSAKHSVTSLHYAGQAVDIRSNHCSNSKNRAIMTQFKTDFATDDFDIVLENNHIHVEYQPKRK